MMWVAQAPHLLRRGLISLCALLSCALLCACAPPHLSDEGSPAPALEEHSAAVSLPGNWLPPPDVLAIGDRISVRRDAEPTIAPQGSCDTPNNPWTCSCEHPRLPARPPRHPRAARSPPPAVPADPVYLGERHLL